MGRLSRVVRQSQRELRDRVAREVARGRQSRRMSQQDLAARVGTSRRTIGRIESRRSTPRPVLLERLDAELGDDQ